MIAAALAWLRARLATLVGLVLGGAVVAGVAAWGASWRRRARAAMARADVEMRRRVISTAAMRRVRMAHRAAEAQLAEARRADVATTARLAALREEIAEIPDAAARWDRVFGSPK